MALSSKKHSFMHVQISPIFFLNEMRCRTFGNGMMILISGFTKLGNLEKNGMKRVEKQPGKSVLQKAIQCECHLSS